jgi:ribonuclease P protein component
MKRQQRLRSATDFKRVRQHAARGLPHPLLVLYVAPNDLHLTRVGITVSGRVGKAVDRNRVRRRLRAALDARLSDLESGHDLVLVARPPSTAATWDDLCQALDRLLSRAGLRVPVSKAQT